MKAAGLLRGPGTAVPIEKIGDAAKQIGRAKSQWMKVTPEKAATWLKNNFRNRPIREDTVKAYARDMINGVWVPTHQGIAFNDRDELIDGQHRLHAIVLANMTIEMMVTFGLPGAIEGHRATMMDAVDRGATRSVADQLTIQHGFSHGSMTAAICAAIASLCCGERTRRLSVAQTLEVYHEFGPSVKFVIAHRSKKIGLRTTGVLAGVAFAHAVSAVIAGKVEEIFARLNGDVSCPRDAGATKAGDPIKLLRDFLRSDEAKLFTRSLDRGLAELVLNALHCELQGKRLPKLEMTLEGADHFRSLQAARVKKVAETFTLPKA